MSCSGSCLKLVAETFGIKSVTRSCSDSCTEGTIDLGFVEATTYCCETDLCNSASQLSVEFITGIVLTISLTIFNKYML